MTESFACDAFLEALNDRELALKIREKEPPSLEDAYQFAMRLEAYNQTPVQSDKERKPQNVRVAHESQDSRNALTNDWREFMREFGQLQHEKFNKLSSDLKEVVTSIIQPSTTSRASADQHVGQSAQPSGGYRRRLPFGRNRECFNCGKEGHLRFQCREPSNRSNDGTTEVNSQTRSQPGQPVLGSPVNQTNHVRGDRGAYLRVKIGRHQHLALLDTGSEVTLVPSKFVSSNQMIPTDQKLQAANGSEITVLGEAELKIKIRGCNMNLNCLVVDNVSEILIGLDWLRRNAATWDFQKKLIVIDGEEYPLADAPREHISRRIILKNDVSIPPESEVNVVCRVVFGDLACYGDCWITQPEQVEESVLVARTLIADGSTDAVNRLINTGPDSVKLQKGSKVCALEDITRVSEATPGSPPDTEHLKSLLAAVDVQVPKDIQSQLEDLLIQYRHIFSTGPLDMGRTELVMHEIDTGDNKPTRQALRPTPMAMTSAIDEHLEEMIQQGIIEPSYSDWASNVVLVKKRDGSLRFCIDYRQLNEKTTKDVYPLPRIDNCLDTLAGAKWFSTFDLRAGYHQVALHPRDAHKTTFITRHGSFQFRVLPFGLCNAPATFERLMDLVMAGLSYEICLVYLDDIIVFSKDLSTHLLRLELIFIRLEAAGLKLKPSKCHLLQTKVLFLGHVVTANGISTDPDKIVTVETWPTPKNLRDVRAFIGLCSYYRRYVRDFATVAEPLHALTKKARKVCLG